MLMMSHMMNISLVRIVEKDWRTQSKQKKGKRENVGIYNSRIDLLFVLNSSWNWIDYHWSNHLGS